MVMVAEITAAGVETTPTRAMAAVTMVVETRPTLAMAAETTGAETTPTRVMMES